MSTNKKSKKLAWIGWGAATLFSILSMICALHPSLRASLRDAIIPSYREVVSTVSGDLFGDGSFFQVVKIKSENGITVEIYGAPSADGLAPLIEKVELSDMRDGYFNFHGEATQLALQDIDGDKKTEILVPSFDRDLVAHLSVFRMLPDSHKIELVTN